MITYKKQNQITKYYLFSITYRLTYQQILKITFIYTKNISYGTLDFTNNIQNLNTMVNKKHIQYYLSTQ